MKKCKLSPEALRKNAESKANGGSCNMGALARGETDGMCKNCPLGADPYSLSSLDCKKAAISFLAGWETCEENREEKPKTKRMRLEIPYPLTVTEEDPLLFASYLYSFAKYDGEIFVFNKTTVADITCWSASKEGGEVVFRQIEESEPLYSWFKPVDEVLTPEEYAREIMSESGSRYLPISSTTVSEDSLKGLLVCAFRSGEKNQRIKHSILYEDQEKQGD